MNFVQCSRCFQLHNHTVFNQKISREISDRMVPIEHPDRLLLLDFQPILPQFDCQGIFVNFFQESRS